MARPHARYRPATAGLLKVLLGLFALVGGASLGHQLSWLCAHASNAGAEHELCLAVQASVLSPALALLAACVLISFTIWLLRARANLAPLGESDADCQGLHWFLVPVFNLFRPFALLRALWERSDPRRLRQLELAAPPARLLQVWWLSWCACLVLATAWLATKALLPQSVVLDVLAGTGLASALTCACLLTAVAHTIHIRQEAKRAGRYRRARQHHLHRPRTISPRVPFPVSCLCGAVLQVRPNLAGQIGRCPECQDSLPLKPAMAISC